VYERICHGDRNIRHIIVPLFRITRESTDDRSGVNRFYGVRARRSEYTPLTDGKRRWKNYRDDRSFFLSIFYRGDGTRRTLFKFAFHTLSHCEAFECHPPPEVLLNGFPGSECIADLYIKKKKQDDRASPHYTYSVLDLTTIDCRKTNKTYILALRRFLLPPDRNPRRSSSRVRGTSWITTLDIVAFDGRKDRTAA